jgi:hypothetical protein
MWGLNLAQQFAATVEVLRVWRILLRVHALATGKHAVGADVN